MTTQTMPKGTYLVVFAVSLGWIVFAVTTALVAVTHDYQSFWLWLSIIASIVGNSAHLVTFSYSQGKILVQATGQSGQPPGQ